jgi:hypothetical protein
MTRHLCGRAWLSAALACVLGACVLGVFTMPRAMAQIDASERAFPQSKAAIEKTLKSLQAALAGRLPTLEGFAASDHPLDRYQRGYYQASVQVTQAPSGGSVVRISVKVTAWYSDPVGARSGYQLLNSNGRLEADLLDQLGEQLAKIAAPGDESAANERKTETRVEAAVNPQPPPAIRQTAPASSAPAPAMTEASRVGPAASPKTMNPATTASAAPVSAAPVSAAAVSAASVPAAAVSSGLAGTAPSAGTSAAESNHPSSSSASASASPPSSASSPSSPFNQTLAEQDRAIPRPLASTGTLKTDRQLQAEIDSLEEVLKNQAHPKNLVAVKKSGTPVVESPSLGAKPLFLASAHDEFEMLEFNRDWVHVRISGLSRGWIWRTSLEMPDGIPDTVAESATAPPLAADLYHVAQEETAIFPGDWPPLRGKSVKIISVQKVDEARQRDSSQDKLEYAKYLLDKNYAEMRDKPQGLAGIVLIFDSADGGMIAATLPTLQQWKAGTMTDAALWHNCFFDPPETFNSAAASGTQ